MTVPVINLDQTDPNKDTVINLDTPKQTKTHLRAIVGLVLTLLVLGAIAFGAGWLSSKIKDRLAAPAQIVGEKTSTSSALPADWVSYKDKTNHFSIAYPKDWTVQAHDTNSPAGVLLSTEISSVELWLEIDQAVSLSDEQKAGLKSTTTTSAQINARPAIVTTNEYQAGNFFNIVVFPATQTQPQVTFWIKAADADTADLGMKIVGTFKFD